ncbi:phosphatase PAP2 family protein [Candidatus Eisenbacteria bacterium]|uniref:Phosphatase PAP2 family protein n=1 Tax=Eiseniibacteriota bacterium TaxID=2212470 RepID=A0ABV6YIL9_UNCEI
MQRPAEMLSPSVARVRGYWPIDIVLLVYLAWTTVLLFVSPLTCPARTELTIVQLVLLVGVALLRLVPRTGQSFVRVVRAWYPVLVLIYFYQTVQYLNRLVTSAYFDEQIVALEQALFGGQPSQNMLTTLPFRLLSEFLHFSYFVYIPMFAAVALFIYLRRKKEEFRVFTTSVLTTFFLCYTVFTIFPVQGPFHHFGPIDPKITGAVFANAVHWMLSGASSLGSAFPSSHVAAATCIWMVSRRSLGRLSWIVMVIAFGILLGTVYGGFHYAIDAIVGLIIGLGMGWLGPRLHRAMVGRGLTETVSVSPAN